MKNSWCPRMTFMEVNAFILLKKLNQLSNNKKLDEPNKINNKQIKQL